jgi:hypothetical protein
VTRYPFSGLLVCACCDTPMVICGGSSQRYYRCGDITRRGICDGKPRRIAGANKDTERTERLIVARGFDPVERVELALDLYQVRNDRDVPNVAPRLRSCGEPKLHDPHASSDVMGIERDQLRRFRARRQREELARRSLQQHLLLLRQERDGVLDGARDGLTDLLLAPAPLAVVVDRDAHRARRVFRIFPPSVHVFRPECTCGVLKREEGAGQVRVIGVGAGCNDARHDRARKKSFELRVEARKRVSSSELAFGRRSRSTASAGATGASRRLKPAGHGVAVAPLQQQAAIHFTRSQARCSSRIRSMRRSGSAAPHRS